MRFMRLDQLREIDAEFPDVPLNTTIVLTPNLSEAFRVWDSELEALEEAGYIESHPTNSLSMCRVLTRHGMRIFNEMNRRSAARNVELQLGGVA